MFWCKMNNIYLMITVLDDMTSSSGNFGHAFLCCKNVNVLIFSCFSAKVCCKEMIKIFTWLFLLAVAMS